MQNMKAAEEWGALAEAGPSDDYVLEEDPEFLSDINRICTFGLKAMLKVQPGIRPQYVKKPTYFKRSMAAHPRCATGPQ